MTNLMHFILIAGFLFSTVIGIPSNRFKRQIIFPDQAQNIGLNQGQFGSSGNQQDPTLVRGVSPGFGQFQPGQDNQGPIRNGITIPANGGTQVFRPANRPPPIGTQPGNGGLTIPGQGGLSGGIMTAGFGPNQGGLTQAPGDMRQSTNNPANTTPVPPNSRTTPSQAYFRCLSNCQTTMEYNPVCGSDTLNYHNMQRLQCAQRCGASVQLIRRGTCLPL